MISGIYGMGYRPYTYSSSPYAVQRQAQGTQQAQSQSAQNAQSAQTQSTSAWAVRRSAAPETPVLPVTPARSVSSDEASVPQLLSRLESDPVAMAGRMRVQYGSVTPEGLFVQDSETASPVQGAAKAALEGQLAEAENALATGVRLPSERPLVEDDAALPETQTDLLPGTQADRPEAETNVLPGTKADSASEAEDILPSQGAEGAQEALEEGECETCKERKYQDGSDDPGVSFKTPTNIAPEQAASAVRGHEMEHVVREQAKAEREDREVVRQTVTMHTDICPECGKAYVSGGTTETVTVAKPDNDTQANNDAQQQQAAAQKQNETRTPFAAVA